MNLIGLRQFSILISGVVMATIGFLGLTQELSLRTVLYGAFLIAIALVSFYIGQTYAGPR
mgnify:CR=1 FL=1